MVEIKINAEKNLAKLLKMGINNQFQKVSEVKIFI